MAEVATASAYVHGQQDQSHNPFHVVIDTDQNSDILQLMHIVILHCPWNVSEKIFLQFNSKSLMKKADI